MAAITINTADVFPDGTSVSAYQRNADIIDGAPSGTAVATATATSGTVSFSGLADNTGYVAYANVAGQDRFRRFYTGVPPSSASSGDPATGPDRFNGEPRVRRRADLTLHPTPPVRTNDTHNPPYAPANSRFIPWDSPLIRCNTQLVPSVTGAAAPGTPSVRGSVTSTGLTGAANETLQGPLPFRWDMILDGSFIAVPIEAPLNATPKCHLYVDGMLATADEEVGLGGMQTWTFADSGPRELCFMFKNAAVKGVHVPLNGDLFPPAWPQGPKVVFAGDSLTEGSVATSTARGFAHLAAWLLGFDNYEANAWGGTGFVATNGGTRPNMLSRIADITSRLTANDLVVWSGLGTNDASMDLPTVKANAKACFQAVQAIGARQVVFGPWYLDEGTAAGAPGVHQQLRQAAAEVGIPFVPTMNRDRWLRGSGHGGTPQSAIGPAITADGNADRYSSGSSAGVPTSRSVHPLNIGHVAQAKWVASRVRRALQPTYVTPTFTPAAFPISIAPSLWYDETGHGVTADAAAINQWSDKSGNGAHLVQATGANQPTRRNNILNGLAVARFDGTNDELIAAAGATVQHVFAVAKYSAATFGGFNGLLMGAANTNGDTVLQGGAAAVAEVQTLTGTATGGTFTITEPHTGLTTAALAFNATAAQVQTALAALYNGVVAAGGPLGTAGVTVTYPSGHGTRPLLVVNAANLTGGGVTVARTTTGVPGKLMTTPSAFTTPRYWKDGEEHPLTAMGGPLNAFAVVSMKSTEWTNPLVPRIGSQASLGGRYWNGDVAEVIAYPTVLSDSDRQAVENFLTNKWGLINWAAL